MNTRLQTSLVKVLFEILGYKVRKEVVLGKGLWKGIRADFVVEGIEGYPDGLAIECKWQDNSGSASEKIVYTVFNIKRCYPIPAILLCSGGELDKALAWAKTEVEGKLVAALGTDELTSWVGKLKKRD